MGELYFLKILVGFDFKEQRFILLHGRDSQLRTWEKLPFSSCLLLSVLGINPTFHDNSLHILPRPKSPFRTTKGSICFSIKFLWIWKISYLLEMCLFCLANKPRSQHAYKCRQLELSVSSQPQKYPFNKAFWQIPGSREHKKWTVE